MTDLGAFTQVCVFQFDEVTHMGLCVQYAARAQAGERAGIAALAHHSAFEVAVGLDHRAFAQRGVLDDAVRADLNIVLDDHLAFENHVDVDEHVTTNGHFTPYIEARRVAQGHALGHQAAAFTQLVVTLQLGQLATVVGALHFHRVVWLLGGHHQAVSHRHGDDVGQVVLALGVVVRQAAHPVGQARGWQRQNTGVAFLDGFLCIVGVLVLNDGSHLALLVTHDTTIAGRVFERDRKQAQLLITGFGQQTLQGLHFDQRHIAVQHQHGIGGQRWQSLGNSMAGTQLFILHDEIQVVSGQALANQLGAMANDHVNTLWLQLTCAVDNMAEHRVAGYRVQHLGQRRAHAGTLAGGENNDIE